MTADARLLRALLRQNFNAFIEKAFATLAPGQTFVPVGISKRSRPDRDKVSRMAVVSAKFEAGQVFLPERASWLADFEAELFAFPGSRKDDQCDL